MYQLPNTPLLFKLIGASSLGLLVIFVVFGFLIPKKELPPQTFVVRGVVEMYENNISVREIVCNHKNLTSWIGKEVDLEGIITGDGCVVTKVQEIIPTEQPINTQAFHLENQENPIVIIRDATFDVRYRYDVTNDNNITQLRFFDTSGIPFLLVSRTKNTADLSQVISEDFSVGHESIVVVGGIAYVRQEIIPLTGNEVSIRTIPGSNCKKDPTCPLLSTQLLVPMTPENLAKYEEIVSRVTFLESGEGLVKFQSALSNGKLASFYTIPGAVKKETDEGVEVFLGDKIIARIKPVAKLPPKNEETISFNIGERKFIVYNSDKQIYYMANGATFIAIEVLQEEGLLTALSLQ